MKKKEKKLPDWTVLKNSHKIYKVIDGDNHVIIQTFTKNERKEVLKRLEEAKRWEDIGTDVEGDIIVYEKL